MDNNKKVFKSEITRANNKLRNNLYDLIHVVPAKPLPVNIAKTPTCDFIPKCDKYYVPKKKIKLKVKTVRHIRGQFEADVYTDLNSELDKQRNVLLRKIRIGSAREEATKKIAKSILSSDFPVSKDVWHMVINLNPESHIYTAQYVLWNGKTIQVNGSKGGKKKFICKYDLGEIYENRYSKQNVSKRNVICNRKGLLQQSVFVKFKPGPLSKKSFLDSSFQKFQCGKASVIKLPKPALDIQPSYGGALEPQMTTFLNKTFMRNSNGEITEKWADFSVSALGVNKNGSAIQSNKDTITFDLQYKCCQNRILMRNPAETDKKEDNVQELCSEENGEVSSDVNIVVSKILDYVEFKLEQDNDRADDDNIMEVLSTYSREKTNPGLTLRDRCKRKYGELDRLDVTIIKIPSSDSKGPKPCNKSYCTLGCICDSLEFPYNLRTHCGRIECMFKCQCSFSKTHGSKQSLHEIIDLDTKIFNPKLAKEEQKFRQTVVLSGEGSIVLNAQKRDWKASKKYADFYSKMCLKSEPKLKKELCIIAQKIDCQNIEPWCMVHNLYKCFCKGKFTEKSLPDQPEVQTMENDITAHTDPVVPAINKINNSLDQVNNSLDVKSRLRVRSKQPEVVTVDSPIPDITTSVDIDTENCARVNPYTGRKFLDDYYGDTNRKILEMERNDRSLLKKLLTLIYTSEEKESPKKENPQHEFHTLEVGQPPTSLEELLNNVVQNKIENSCVKEVDDSHKKVRSSTKRLPNKTKLVAWLEASYKQYKDRAENGLNTTSLDPPKLGKVALYPWEFILGRYRERKNLFLITKQKPYRILMAVNTKNPFFESCININDIVLTDLEKYPITVKNLLTNATDLKDNFCILCGLAHCWELIGSVTKVKEPKKSEGVLTSFNCDSDSLDSDKDYFDDSASVEDSSSSQENSLMKTAQNTSEQAQQDEIINNQNDTDLSKWFVMTVEKDFDEIHFYKKGFFVKYDSVIKAINVSRVSGKTVRLSSQKCINPQTSPQFGIYAIPNESDLNVFIGPYERHEPLGIETVKTNLPSGYTKKTRGTWIMVNKVDNVKIIDEPLTFLPSTYLKLDMILLDNEKLNSPEKNEAVNKKPEVISSVTKKEEKPICKMIKPIKIRKSNNLFNIIKSFSRPILSQTPTTFKSAINTSNGEETTQDNKSTSSTGNSNLIKKSSTPHKPVAEIAPQVKPIKPRSEATPSVEPSMFILKPEEINKRSLLGQISTEPCEDEEVSNSMEMDIENFLATSSICKLPNTGILVISDDEDDEQNKTKNVWIQCTNVEKLGWIPAKRNADNYICFEFPGFKCTSFYPENEAFQKLNSVFSRKVYVPKNFKIQWEVVEKKSDLRFQNQLKSLDLRPEYVMTKRGLRHKHELMEILKMKRELSESEPKSAEFIKRRRLLMDLEDITSEILEDNSKTLLNKTMTKKGVLLQRISSANENLREEMSAKLNALYDDSDST